MNIKDSFNWLLTGFLLTLLKRSTRHRLKGAGADWLQPIRSKPSIVNRVDYILDYCRNKKVLHIGFTDHPFTIERMNTGALLHSRLKSVTTDLAGIDNDAGSISRYRELTNDPQVYEADITVQYPDEATRFKPGVILLSEVLEHLSDPYKAIDILHKSFDAGVTVMVTVPNYTAMDSIAASLHQTESIHPDHFWYFSPYTLCRLLDEKRFELKQIHFGMYYQPHTRINAIMKAFPFNGDCIIGVFSIIKNGPYA